MNYVVNFFSQREYERIPEMLKAGSKEVVADPKNFGENKKH